MSRRNLVPAVLTLLSIVLILFTGWSLNHFRRFQPYVSFLTQNEFGARQFALQLTDVELRGRSHGEPQWSVHASLIQLTPDQSSITIDTLDHGILMRDAKPYLEFVAKRAIYALGGSLSSAGIVQVLGGIHIDSTGPITPLDAPISVTAQSADWNGYQAVLTLPEKVQIVFGHTQRSPGISLDSQGIKWNAKSYQLTCPERVHADVDALGSYGPYQVDSSDLLYDEPSGQIRCANPISIVVPALGTATCKSLMLDSHQHTSDFGHVQIVADAAAVIAPMPTPAPPTAQSPAKSGDDADDNKVTVDAPGGGHWDEQTKILTVKGPVVFHQGDMTMTTVGATYDRKSDIATGDSPVTIKDPQSTITGDVGSVDFKHHIATLNGHIHIDVEPKPDEPKPDKNAKLITAPDDSDTSSDDSATKQPSVMTCDAIDYNYRKKLAVTKGTVVITQKHRKVTSDEGTYNTATHIADLVGHVIADSDDGKHMEADAAEISLKKGDEWIDIPKPKVIQFDIPAEDNPKATSSPPGSAAPSPPAASRSSP